MIQIRRFIVITSGLKILRDQRRLMQAKELFASVNVSRSVGMDPGGRLTLRSRHRLNEPAEIDRVEYTLLRCS